MTWIETVPLAAGDEALARANATQRALCPGMYDEPSPPRDDGREAESTRISPAHRGRLRAVGFDDRGILQIALIARGSSTSIGWPMRCASGATERDARID